MEELLNKLKSLNAIRALGFYADYDPEGEHKDTIYFAEDQKKIYLNGEDYGGITSELYNELIDLVNNKVEKVLGKQLSTEDFTTNLKAKLEGLTNYDDKNLTDEINSLKLRLNTILDSDNTTAVIDTFLEVETFLQGVTNQQTLTGLLQEMKSEIAQLCADTYITSMGGVVRATQNNTSSVLKYQNESAGLLGMLGFKFDKTPAAYLVDSQGSPTIVRSIVLASGTSSQFLKADGSVDSTAYLPKTNGTHSGNLTVETTSDGGVVIKPIKQRGGQYVGFLYKNATDDDILGGIGSHIYSTKNEDGSYTNSINGFTIGWGTAPWSEVNSVYVNDTKFTYKSNKVWHEGNDGSGSGLDADLLDGINSTGFMRSIIADGNDVNELTVAGSYRIKSNVGNTPNGSPDDYYGNALVVRGVNSDTLSQLFFPYTKQTVYLKSGSTNTDNRHYIFDKSWREFAFTDSNVASADKLTTKLLTNEDLNDIKGNAATIYYASGSNTCTNKPHNNVAFNLQVFRMSDTFLVQIFTVPTGIIYIRGCNAGIWREWHQLATADEGVNKLNHRSIYDEDLNDLNDRGLHIYIFGGGNSLVNLPFSTGYGGVLEVNGRDEGQVIQTVTQFINDKNIIYKRTCVSDTWMPWKRILTEDDPAPKLTTKQLTDEDLDNIKDINFSSYYATKGNTVLNKPEGVDNFGLQSYSFSNANRFILILTGVNGKIYKRYMDGTTWSPWKKMLEEDDITSLVSRIEALESQLNS